MKPVVLVALLTFLLPVAASAAPCTIDQPVWSGFGGASPPEGVGQSFTACESGWVTSVSVFIALTPPSGPVEVQVQPGLAIHPQTTPQSHMPTSGWNTIVLDDPVPVVAGNVYSWGIMPTAGALWLHFNEGDVYPAGAQLHWNGTTIGEHVTRDYEFRVEITDDETVEALDLAFGALKARYR